MPAELGPAIPVSQGRAKVVLGDDAVAVGVEEAQEAEDLLMVVHDCLPQVALAVLPPSGQAARRLRWWTCVQGACDGEGPTERLMQLSGAKPRIKAGLRGQEGWLAHHGVSEHEGEPRVAVGALCLQRLVHLAEG